MTTSQQTVLITGGNKGIGLELTRGFLQLGYNIIVVARDFELFEFSGDPQVKMVTFDLGNVDRIPELVAALPLIDILMNNAGVMYSHPYDDYPKEKSDDMLKLNLVAPVQLIESVSREMLKQGGGRIVNNASVAAYTGHPDIWYGITKAGLVNATKSFAKIFEGKIIVNAVAASPVDTEMQKVNTEARKLAFKNSTISKRFAMPEEVAKTMIWLATESPDYINGTCIDINNGSYPR